VLLVCLVVLVQNLLPDPSPLRDVKAIGLCPRSNLGDVVSTASAPAAAISSSAPGRGSLVLDFPAFGNEGLHCLVEALHVVF
jgi:hypothetical protein